MSNLLNSYKFDLLNFFFLDSLNTKNLAECLTPTSRFAYCALCATSLSCLYKDPVHDDFKLNCLRTLCNHLKLMLQLRTMREMANCELPLDAKVYVKVLKKDEELSDGMMVIVQDLLLLAISNGKNKFLLCTYVILYIFFKYYIIIIKHDKY